MWAFWNILLVASSLHAAWAFVAAGVEKSQPRTFLSMVRNIDLPECLVFYGDNMLDEQDADLQSLLQEGRKEKARKEAAAREDDY